MLGGYWVVTNAKGLTYVLQKRYCRYWVTVASAYTRHGLIEHMRSAGLDIPPDIAGLPLLFRK